MRDLRRDLRPEVAAVNMGSFNCVKYSPRRRAFVLSELFVNPLDEIVALLDAVNDLGIQAELECFDVGHVGRLPTMPGMSLFRDGLLDGQVAIVSGGGSGLGRATALELAGLGARVFVCGRRAEPLEETAAMHERIEARACDIRDETAVGAFVDHVLAQAGQIDLLVNNAGGQFLAPAEDVSPKGFRTVMTLNVEGTWLMTHAVATKAMIPARGGKIVSVTLSPHNGHPGLATSTAARAAVENLMRSLATEWAQYGIRLTAIAAGQFGTDTFISKYPAKIVAGIAETIPLGRLGKAEELAWLVAFLASPAGDFFTGSVLTLDGGRDNWYGRWPQGLTADDSGQALSEDRR